MFSLQLVVACSEYVLMFWYLDVAVSSTILYDVCEEEKEQKSHPNRNGFIPQAIYFVAGLCA